MPKRAGFITEKNRDFLQIIYINIQDIIIAGRIIREASSINFFKTNLTIRFLRNVIIPLHTHNKCFFLYTNLKLQTKHTNTEKKKNNKKKKKNLLEGSTTHSETMTSTTVRKIRGTKRLESSFFFRV